MKVDVFEVREDRTYSRDHVWAKPDGEVLKLGVDDFTQKMLEFVESVRLPEPGARVVAGEPLAGLTATRRVCQGGLCTFARESADVVSPVTGTVVEVNTELADSPELLQVEPYDSGWLAVVLPDEVPENANLVTAEQMRGVLEADIPQQPVDILERVRAAWG